MPRKSELFTEDPFYLPKYCGYLPQYKYRIGKTYGRHSVEILTDADVRRSGRYVLADVDAPPHTADSFDERRQLLRTRSDSFGNQTLTDEMVPGYAGYIPKRQHYFAKSYAEVCRDALSHHEVEQREITQDRRQFKKAQALQTGEIRPQTESDHRMMTSRYQTPLSQHMKDAAPYKSPQEFRPPVDSPYFLDDAHKMKWFKSGYTGFVPRTRELIALGYPAQSNRGLRTFSKNMSAHASQSHQPVTIQRKEFPQPTKATIYPSNIGMIPHYTGYIPGFKYQIGHTYGQHTFNTLKLPPADKIAVKT